MYVWRLSRACSRCFWGNMVCSRRGAIVLPRPVASLTCQSSAGRLIGGVRRGSAKASSQHDRMRWENVPGSLSVSDFDATDGNTELYQLIGSGVCTSLVGLISFYVTRYKEGIIIPERPVIFIVPLSNPFSIGGTTRLPGTVASVNEKVGALMLLVHDANGNYSLQLTVQ